MDILFIRHSITKGNLEKRYIGRTDEPLCKQGIDLLSTKVFPCCDSLYTSPMKRCIQTGRLLFPDLQPRVLDDLRECDFGEFENKNYLELSGNPDYQKWIDSGGRLPFPGGESQEEFQQRSIRGFLAVVEEGMKNQKQSIAMVVHGGTIMSVMEAFEVTQKDYFSWQVKNAGGYFLHVEEELWKKNKPFLVIKNEF
jgi:alpha-ribazole phosphatase